MNSTKAAHLWVGEGNGSRAPQMRESTVFSVKAGSTWTSTPHLVSVCVKPQIIVMQRDGPKSSFPQVISGSILLATAVTSIGLGAITSLTTNGTAKLPTDGTYDAAGVVQSFFRLRRCVRPFSDRPAAATTGRKSAQYACRGREFDGFPPNDGTCTVNDGRTHHYVEIRNRLQSHDPAWQ